MDRFSAGVIIDTRGYPCLKNLQTPGFDKKKRQLVENGTGNYGKTQTVGLKRSDSIRFCTLPYGDIQTMSQPGRQKNMRSVRNEFSLRYLQSASGYQPSVEFGSGSAQKKDCSMPVAVFFPQTCALGGAEALKDLKLSSDLLFF